MATLTRRIQAILTADSSQFDQAMKGAVRSLDGVSRAAEKVERQSGLQKLSNSLRDNSQAWDEVSNKSLIAGGAIAAGLGLATKAAISWESAFAGVKKTVDDTEEGYAALEQELRDLTKVLPATHEEIAGVAEAAGQLGVQRENIVEFTRIMIDLGESTNLSAEEAATGLARFANVMGTSLGDVDRLGAALVGLGNNFATTESEILAMATRLTGAGRQAGMTEGDVLGLAAAARHVGIEAEAGGTAFSRVMTEIGIAADVGGEAIEGYARVAGMGAAEFTKLWETASGEAFTRFIRGLGDVQARGESLEPIFDELGMTDIRVGDAFRKAAAASDMFATAMAQGNAEYEKNSALTEEAAKRYETAAAQLDIARNQIKNAAIDAGAVLAPVLVDIAQAVASIAGAFADLPKPVQQAVVWLSTFASAGLLAFGGAVKMARAGQELSDAMKTLGVTAPGAAAGVTKVGKAATGALVLVGLAAAINSLNDSLARRGVKQVDDFADALDRLGDKTADISELGDLFEKQNMISWLPWRKEITTTDEVLKAFAEQAERALAGSWTDRLERFLGNGSLARFQEQAAQIDAQLESMINGGNLDGAVNAFEMFTEAAVAQGVPLEELTRLFPLYAAALESAQAAEAAAGIEEVNAILREQEEALEEAKEAFIEWRNEVAGSDAAFINLLGAWDSVIEKNKEVATAAAEATKSTKDSWEDFYDGHTVKIDDYLEELERMVEAQLNWETNMIALSGRVSQGIIDELARLGPEGAPLVAALVDASDDELERLEAVYRERSGAATEAFAMNLRLAGPVLADIMRIAGQDAADEAAAALASGEKTLQDVIDDYDLVFEIDADTGEAVRGIKGLYQQYHNGRLVIRVVSDTTSFVVPRSGQRVVFADGGLMDKRSLVAFASGGMFQGTFATAQPQIRPYMGPRGVLWGEEGSGPWEAFISGHPGKRLRSRRIADEVVARLGGRIDWIAAYANGGIREMTNVANYYAAPSGGARDVQVNIPVQTYVEADPVAIGASVAWQVGGLP